MTRKFNNNGDNFIMATGTMKGIEAFAGTVKTAMEAHYGDDYRVTVQNVTKNNGIVLTGITVLKKDCNIAPTIYLNQAYEQYQKGRTLSDICKEVIYLYEEYKVQKSVDISFVTDFSKVKSRICYKLINAQKNKALLKDAPHVFVEDLAVIFYILVSGDAEETGMITVKNDMKKLWNVTTDVRRRIEIGTNCILNSRLLPIRLCSHTGNCIVQEEKLQLLVALFQ